MKTLPSTQAAQNYIRKQSGKLVLVPTMGALHDGHAILLAAARAVAGPSGKVVATIFVNPTQFGPGEDLARYPRTPEADLKICRREKVDAVFMPEPGTMYAPGHSVFVREDSLSGRLCGASRPGHFQGVCTIVAKLFLLFQPTHAVFGEKDWQQLAIIRRMVRDLNFPVQVVGYPTVREADGLALSSRNRYLSPAERATAPGIHQALRTAALDLQSGHSISRVQSSLRRRLRALPGGCLDYAEVVDAETLEPTRDPDRPLQAIVALQLGKARLIDNLRLNPGPLAD